MNVRSMDKNRINKLLNITESISHVRDIDSLLGRILLEARLFTNADAGSIFLKEEDKLAFSYVQNDGLFHADEESNKYLYMNHSIPVNKQSIAGYAAATGEVLNIRDVYKIPDTVPYSFNSSFDQKSNYKTQSVLTVPMITSTDNVVGVLQIINALDSKKRVKRFSKEDEFYVRYFADNAAVAVERAKMTREIILRMIRMSELRDPRETGAHVNRVGAYSIEIYEKWARINGIEETEIKRFRDILRITAMLHDVGKVAITDAILKKPARLDPDEYEIMKRHTIYGAQLFRDPASEFDRVASEIALNHHERWDGKGYPGKLKDLFSPEFSMGEGKNGELIPLTGRIVALADVYDALMSKRAYKDPWPEEKVLEYIHDESGKQFDPSVVTAFESIYQVIKAIRAKFSDQPME